ncbi:low affinity iron permease family protein [Bordetella hinzii]|uniref:low affinity iron permease family protein n=1 Tax=Bordetella hinzii TaxID=103855 RepID=UPI0005180A27|nr:low affinity iron permease family protein [Bordetella hinzii]QDJ42942.1 low affinity iron permease family protein [Bordetella hinzii]QDJ47513.1 low affinity iron permease family protein [Bordetella hinzii]QWF38384.1 low affinity iron permease family protein [Bordetella hinzii]QWF42929.1 low affinity iron permease family protein [Bordetella hinzii]QWF47470.1 low affinity iron permease family protein [Bordetella hinzii]
MIQSRPRRATTAAQPQAASRMARGFDHFARFATRWTGSSLAFAGAVALVLGWAVCGPLFGYSETWQLVINTGTTIITFLMVFLIQQSQNKDSQALHLKLDELLLAVKGASDSLVDAEDLDEAELRQLAQHYADLAHRLQGRLRRIDERDA